MVILQGEEQGPLRKFLISRLGKVRVECIQKDFMVLKSWEILRNYGNMPENTEVNLKESSHSILRQSR